MSTPYNYGVIMGGRHKNFEDWTNIELLNYENKNLSVSFFLGQPVQILSGIQNDCEVTSFPMTKY